MNYQPGEKAPKSGEYKVVNENGKIVQTVNVSKGDTLPPTQKSTYHYEINN